jgi:hypothetical protein
MIAAPILDGLLDELARVIGPAPRPRRLLDFAMSLRLPEDATSDDVTAGSHPPYDPSTHPAQFEFLKAYAAGGYFDMVVLGPVQDGKTWAVEVVPTLYALAEQRVSVVYGCPDRPFCGKMWRTKFLPAIEASGLRHLLPLDGPGSDGGVPDDTLMTTGARLFLLGAGARNEAGQAGVTAPIVIIGERSKIRPRFVELLLMRKEAYGARGRGVSTSTISNDDFTEGDDDQRMDSTVVAYERSTRGRLWFRCCHCAAEAHPSGGWQTFEWSRVEADWSSDESARDTARLHCAHEPKHALTDGDRRRSLREWRLAMHGQTVTPAGEVTGTRLPALVWGLRWTALDSPLKELGALAVKYRQAVALRDGPFGDHHQMVQFTRDFLVERYTSLRDPAESPRSISRSHLAERSSLGWAETTPDRDSESDRYLWSRHVAPWPDAAPLADVAIDVQENRIYWAVGGADRDFRTWDVAWGYEYANADRDPLSRDELHELLDRVRDLVPELIGAKARLVVRAIDVGYRQEDLVEWMRRNPEWVPIAGAGDEAAGHLRRAHAGGDVPGVIYRHRPEGWRLSGRKLHTVDAGRVREQAQASYLRPIGAAGSAHLPKGLRVNDAYVKHLCGELLIEDPKTGAKRWKATPGTRHDWLDIKVYRYAMMRLYLAQLDRGDGGSSSSPRPVPSGPPQPPPRVDPIPSGGDMLAGGADFLGSGADMLGGA